MSDDFLRAAYDGKADQVAAMLEAGTAVDAKDENGMTALHLAVGRGHLELVKLLIDHDAPFVPDGFGRMPSLIAAEMQTTDSMIDLVNEAESAAEGDEPMQVQFNRSRDKRSVTRGMGLGRLAPAIEADEPEPVTRPGAEKPVTRKPR